MKITEIPENLEEFLKNLEEEELNIKEIPFEQKIEFLKKCFSLEEINNASILFNIYILIKTNNNFEDEFFESDKVFFNNIEEFLDIKFELKDEIQVFTKELIESFLSAILGFHITEQDVTSDFIQIPLKYQKILYTADFHTISKLFEKVKKYIDLANVKPSVRSENIIYNHAEKLCVNLDVFNMLKE